MTQMEEKMPARGVRTPLLAWGEDAMRTGTNETGFKAYLQCATRERTGGGVGTEARTDCVCNSNGDQFLVRIDLVSINTTKC